MKMKKFKKIINNILFAAVMLWLLWCNNLWTGIVAGALLSIFAFKQVGYWVSDKHFEKDFKDPLDDDNENN